MEKQTQRVVEYLATHYHITAKQAMDDLGIYRLGARIYDLKQSGVDVRSGWKEELNRYGEKCRVKMYWLPGLPEYKGGTT